MTNISASEVFVRDMTEVLTFPDGVREHLIARNKQMGSVILPKSESAWSEVKFVTSPRSRSISDILDEKLAPLRILYPSEYQDAATCSTLLAEQPPNVEPVPISREFATPAVCTHPDSSLNAATRSPLPWVDNGKIIGTRHYGDFCVNVKKNLEVTVVSPDEPETDAAPASGSSCVIL